MDEFAWFIVYLLCGYFVGYECALLALVCYWCDVLLVVFCGFSVCAGM